jgi:hypothetical protein
MEVDFNNLRKQTCDAYDFLATRLNGKIANGVITIDAEMLDDVMGELKSYISAIAAAYCTNPDEKMDDVLGDRELVTFNPEDNG